MLFTKNLALLSISVIKQVNNSTGSPKQDRKQKYLCRHGKEGDMSAGHLKLVSIAAGQRAKAAGWMPLERPRKILHHTDSTIHLQGNITLALTEIFPRLQWFNSTTTSPKPQKVEANLLERRSQQPEKSSCSLKSTQVQPHQIQHFNIPCATPNTHPWAQYGYSQHRIHVLLPYRSIYEQSINIPYNSEMLTTLDRNSEISSGFAVSSAFCCLNLLQMSCVDGFTLI